MLAGLVKFTRTLHARILLALVLIGILPLGLIGIGLSFFQGRTISEQSARELVGLARGLAGQLDVLLNGLLEDARAISALPEISGMDRARQNALLKELFHYYPQFARLSVFDRTGQRVASSHHGGAPSIAARKSFQTAIHRGHQSWEVAQALTTGRFSLLIHTPIRDQDRAVVGVLGGVVDLEALSNAISTVLAGGGDRGFVLDADRHVLLHPDRATVQTHPDYSWIGVPGGGRPAGPGTVRYEAQGERRIAGYAPVPNFNWTVLVERLEKEILIPSERSWRVALTGLGLSVVLALLSAAYFARRLTRPVSELAKAARAFEAGNLSGPPPAIRAERGDVGELVGAFAAMRSAVQRRETALRRQAEEQAALSGVAMAASQSLQIEEMLEITLEKILEVTGRDAGFVRIKEGLSGRLRLAAHRGISEAYAGVFASGERVGHVAANVLATGKPQTMNDPSPGDLLEETWKEGIRAAAWIPIQARGRVMGVLTVASKTARAFVEREVALLEAIGNVLGTAVANARLYEETRLGEAQLQETNRMLSALHSVAAAASQSLDLDQVLQAAIDKIKEIFRFDATRIHLFSGQTDELVLRASFEHDPDRWTPARSFRTGQGIVGKVAESGKPLIFEDVQTDPVYQQFSRTKVSGQFGYHFFAVFPIKGKQTCLGTLGCISRFRRHLSAGEVRLLEAITDQIATAIENSQLYQEMVVLARQLSQSNKVKDEFLSVMSHELRTPLNVIMGYAAIIRDGMLGSLNAEQERAVEKILGRARDQLTMITSILQATQMEVEEVGALSEEFRLGDFLRDLRASYEGCREKDLALEWDYPTGLPVVKTDREKLRHILRNLIDNALKFTEKGSVMVSVRVKEDLKGWGKAAARDWAEGWIEFAVRDTGIGIPGEALPFIFEKFRQVDSSETRLYGGVGLGLYIVKRYTELLGGKIEVESEPGKGSTFIVRIPAVANAALAAETENRSRIAN